MHLQLIFLFARRERQAFEEHEFLAGDFVGLDFDFEIAGFEFDLAKVEGHIHALLVHFAWEFLRTDGDSESAAEGLLTYCGDGAAVGFDLGFVRFGGVVVERGLEGSGLGETGFPKHGAVFAFPAFRMGGDRSAFAEAPAFSVHWAEKLSGEDAEFVVGVRL